MTTLTTEQLSSYLPGDRLSDVKCVVSSVEHVRTPTFQFVTMSLSDSSGDFRATLMPFDEESYLKLQAADVIRVWGFVETRAKYRGQITVENFAAVTDLAELGPFLQPLPENHAEQVEKLNALISSIRNKWLSGLLKRLFDNAGPTFTQFSGAVAAKTMHHAFRGGLLEHTVEVANLCSSAASTLANVNRDLVVTGAILHDLGKIDEIDHGLHKGEYTRRGNLIGHIVSGMYRVRHVMDEMDGFPETLKDDLCHLILSHHGAPEYGAARVPATPEAIILACCDVMSARVYQLNDATQRVRDNTLLLPTGGAS